MSSWMPKGAQHLTFLSALFQTALKLLANKESTEHKWVDSEWVWLTNQSQISQNSPTILLVNRAIVFLLPETMSIVWKSTMEVLYKLTLLIEEDSTPLSSLVLRSKSWDQWVSKWNRCPRLLLHPASQINQLKEMIVRRPAIRSYKINLHHKLILLRLSTSKMSLSKCPQKQRHLRSQRRMTMRMKRRKNKQPSLRERSSSKMTTWSKKLSQGPWTLRLKSRVKFRMMTQ